MISPSAIALQGLNAAPADSMPAPQSTRCVACGVAIPEGDPLSSVSPSKSTFTDWQYLDGTGTDACPACAALFTNTLLTRAQKCVINEQGAWSLSKDAHRAWLLMTPPEPPFVAVISDAMKQHLIWRAPVTLDPDLIQIQIGRSSIVIDRPLLLEAVDWCAEAAQLAREQGLKVTPNHPFATLDRNLTSLNHGAIRTDIASCATDVPELRDHLIRLAELGEGELWGLAILAKAKPKEPLCEPI